MKELILSDEDGVMELDFFKLGSYDEFDKIVSILINRFNAMTLIKVDGPESRIWEFLIDGAHIRLSNNPYGNFIKGTEKDQKDVIKQIYRLWKLYS